VTVRACLALLLACSAGAACGGESTPLAAAAEVAAHASAPAPAAQPGPVRARQLLVVTTPAWDSVSGTLRRYERVSASSRWRPVGEPVPIVVGQTGLAWGDDALGRRRDPRKREGDGKAPAGRFPLDTAFGFASATALDGVRLPYLPLGPGTECVDDTGSAHYNTVVDRGAVTRVDWTSAERMRSIDLYRLGVIVGYNARPVRRGRGSCIFLHIWRSAGAPTSGCTAMPASDLETIVRWLDPSRRPMLVQLPVREYARLRGAWSLP
jgi:L,D-peptidoglycan transpeptidase YkuD (ErfK/YbiS/YcfS/YnhG family)